MTTPFLKIAGIRKQFGPITAVEDVTLDVEEGEFLTFLGPSGSGKSTTLYAIAGFQQPTAGTIELNGKSLLEIPPHKRNIGMVFQRYTLFPHLSVGENIAFPLKVRRMSRHEVAAKVKKALKLVQLEGFEDRKPGEMSGGQQQRVALARALAYDPPVLLMDEPLSALDKKLREEMQYQIRRIHRDTAVTILYVTHDQEEALRLSDRIAVFSRGVIDQIGTGPELYANPATRFVAEFIGDSDTLRGHIVSRQGSSATIRIGEHTVIPDVPAHGDVEVGERASLLLRPERISLARQRPDNQAGINVTVRDIAFLGNNTHVSAVTEWDETLSVRLPFGHDAVGGLGHGDKVWINWDPESAHVFQDRTT